MCRIALFIIRKSHAVRGNNQRYGKGLMGAVRIPTASVAIIEGFIIFSSLLCIPFVLSAIFALRLYIWPLVDWLVVHAITLAFWRLHAVLM